MAQAARRSRLRELMFTMCGGGAGTGGLGAITVAAAVLCVLAAAALGMGFGTARGVLIERSSEDGVSAAAPVEDVDSESDDTRQQDADDDAATDAAHDEADEDAATVTVDVSGAVATPSVVTLAEGSRVADAIDAAGSALPDADLARECGFSMGPVLATNEEINGALREIANIIGRLRENEPAEGRRFHTIGLILSPPHS